MKTIVLGDTHGRDFWKKVIEKEEYDKIIFIGDYFDTHDDISGVEQLSNFNEIVKFKRESDKEVVLLVGNHDLHYIDPLIGPYSGYNKGMSMPFLIALKDALKSKDLVAAHLMDNYLFTHAGLSEIWAKNNEIDLEGDIVEQLNMLLYHRPIEFEFAMGSRYSPYGDDITQGPMWIRPFSLSKVATDHFHVVGHTQMDEIKIDDNVAYIDCINAKQFLVIEDGSLSIDIYE